MYLSISDGALADVDGDGWEDLMLAGYDSERDHSIGMLAYGPFDAGSYDVSDVWDAVFDGDYSHSLRTLGDLDLDGKADLSVWASGDDTLATDGGALYLLSGR